MKIGFFILSHQFNQHYDRLLNSLFKIQNSSICIHHDFSQSNLPDYILSDSRIKFVKEFRKTKWADISYYFSTIDGLKMLYHSDQRPQWYINLSASEYPIKSPEYIVNYLKNADFDAFINTMKMGGQNHDLDRAWRRAIATKKIFSYPSITREFRYCVREFRCRRKQANDFLKNHDIYYGSDWWIFNDKTVSKFFSHDPYANQVVKLIEQVNKTDIACPTEVIWHTMMMNYFQDLRISQDCLRFIDWTDAKDWHPNILTMEHWDKIRASNALFARKFDAVKSRELLDRIDKAIL